MAENITSSGSKTAKKKMPRGKPFTPETSRKMQLNASAARAARAQLRYAMLRDAKDKIKEYWQQAIETADADLLDFCEKACRIIGADFKSSPEFVQKSEVIEDVKAKVDNTVTFKLAGPKDGD